ncbi:MAG: hypothetical protein COB14_03375 [Alphaproteobacteria bacterium]|nr:MAG: hypothetical protein COB14_03375 [Alphaproteobacteria bacterium]
MKKILFVTSACLCLSACGFEPIYGTHMQSNAGQESVQSQLAQVSINGIPDREGQFLRNALIDKFYRDGHPQNPRYTLQIEPINESTVDLDITKSSDATRAQLHLKTSMRLIDEGTGEIVLTRSLRSIASYNVLTSEFATRVSAQNTRENALNDLARQIELQISLYLRRD